MSKDLPVRLPDDLAGDAEAIARRRKDPKFKARIRKIIEEDREILNRLAQ